MQIALSKEEAFVIKGILDIIDTFRANFSVHVDIDRKLENHWEKWEENGTELKGYKGDVILNLREKELDYLKEVINQISDKSVRGAVVKHLVSLDLKVDIAIENIKNADSATD